MPVSFCFKKPDDTVEDLNVIDDKIAEFFGKEKNKIGGTMSFMDLVSDAGVAILYGTAACTMTKDIFDKWFSKFPKEKQDDILLRCDGKLIACLRKFLYEDYVFEAWR